MQIHEKIEQARASAGLTQDEMAEKLGIKRSTYQYWEKKTPGIDKIKQVSKVLNLPDDYFFGNYDEKNVSRENKDRGKSLSDLAIFNLTESNRMMAEAMLKAEDNRKTMIDENRELVGMVKGSIVNAPEERHRDAAASRFAILELTALIGSGKRWKSSDEVLAVYNKLVAAALEGEVSSDGTQKSSDKQHMQK